MPLPAADAPRVALQRPPGIAAIMPARPRRRSGRSSRRRGPGAPPVRRGLDGLRGGSRGPELVAGPSLSPGVMAASAPRGGSNGSIGLIGRSTPPAGRRRRQDKRMTALAGPCIRDGKHGLLKMAAK
ncbi:hypothetical protein [Sorangium sp. So ce1389]|uniref:hypothetical protein n=1 Tax=Sorangium sp. So ce1389 TaxID=3133336 RepID=UPI003F60EEE2